MPKVKEKPSAPSVNTYGIRINRPLNQIQADMLAFAENLPFERTGLTRVQLFRRISDALVPGYFEWHEWTERQIEGLCNNRWVALSGCSNSAKTHNVIGFAVVWWLCAPDQSSVILCSTTTKALRRRGWSNVMACYQAMGRNRFGNFVDSRLIWQCEKSDGVNRIRDDKHAILGIAVEEGSTVKVADGIKGHHTLRQMVIIDEATAVPEAIYDATSNLWSYPAGQKRGEFIMVAIGNPRSRLDQFGRFCEPKNGWSSVTVETEEWETRPQLDSRCGVVIRFDALKSPNITAGKKISNHLPTKEMVDAAIKREGSENDPRFWSNMRGFWAPEGLTLTVFTDAQLRAAEAFSKFTFIGETFIVAGFDPAFSAGGDRAVIQPGRVGRVTGGNFGIQLLPRMILTLDATSTNPISFQLTEKLRQYAELIGLDPKNLCMDCTGEGGAIGDIIWRTWSRDIIRVEFQWGASKNPVSHEDARPGDEVYLNKATEMAFQAREYTNAGQIRGVDSDLATELTARLYDPETGGKKRKLEKKIEMKARLGKSPDLFDAFILMCESTRRRGVKIAPIGLTKTRTEAPDEAYEKAVKAVTQDLFQPDNEQAYFDELQVA